jgi:hypothetical protein
VVAAPVVEVAQARAQALGGVGVAVCWVIGGDPLSPFTEGTPRPFAGTFSPHHGQLTVLRRVLRKSSEKRQ